MVNSQNIISLYSETKAVLKSVGIENFRMEASLLIEKVTGIKSHEIAIKGEGFATNEQVEFLNEMLERRQNFEPLQYILGEWEFFGLNFNVGSGVLIPRQDTETLVEVVLDELKSSGNPCIIDLCSGSGCIAISLEKNLKNAEVFVVELSNDAVKYLSQNALLNNSKVEIIKGDIFDKNILNKFDLVDCIVSNPPYINENDMKNLQSEVQFEPSMALAGGVDGLDFYERIVELWKEKLKPNGLIAFEIGINQEEDVRGILIENGFKNVTFKEDLCGITRVVFARKI